MITSQSPKVSIVECKEYEDFDKVKECVRELVDNIGGFESLITPGDRVLIKPNLVTGDGYKTGATTNPNVVFAAAELCREAGAKKITIGEGSAVGVDTDQVFKELDMITYARKHGCDIVNLTKDEFVHTLNPAAKNIKRIRIPRTFIESNVVINIPVMKCHDALGVTLGLKNMKGILHISDKKRFHKWGLSQCVVDLGHIAMPELTIIDATVALEGMGPVVGSPVGLGLLLASNDTVAVDRVGIEIMGFSLEEIEYIRLAGESGLGTSDISEIKVIGKTIDQVRRPFARYSHDREQLEKYGIRIVECDACSGCNNAINSYVYGLTLKGNLKKLEGCTLIYGQTPRIPENNDGKVIKLGVCTKNSVSEKEIYVPGCPPHPMHIDDFLEGKGLEKE
jgi:uncharacterized protein (DUF362 family)